MVLLGSSWTSLGVGLGAMGGVLGRLGAILGHVGACMRAPGLDVIFSQDYAEVSLR